jgi:hypothetical protein
LEADGGAEAEAKATRPAAWAEAFLRSARRQSLDLSSLDLSSLDLSSLDLSSSWTFLALLEAGEFTAACAAFLRAARRQSLVLVVWGMGGSLQ